VRAWRPILDSRPPGLWMWPQWTNECPSVADRLIGTPESRLRLFVPGAGRKSAPVGNRQNPLLGAYACHVDLITVYDLHEDTRHIELVQAATLNRPGFGVQPVPALFGSKEWWSAIGSPQLPIHRVAGTISKVFWGSMGDWPEFILRSDDGTETTWTRQGDYTRYVEGLRVEVQYVVQLFKEDSSFARTGQPLEHNVILRVLVEESERRSGSDAPGPGGITDDR